MSAIERLLSQPEEGKRFGPAGRVRGAGTTENTIAQRMAAASVEHFMGLLSPAVANRDLSGPPGPLRRALPAAPKHPVPSNTSHAFENSPAFVEALSGIADCGPKGLDGR